MAPYTGTVGHSTLGGALPKTIAVDVVLRYRNS